jgi:hypothetical protein
MLLLAMKFDTKARLVFLLMIAITIALGLSTRLIKRHFFTVGDAAGDALWATMVFFILSFISPTMPLWQRILIAVGFSFAIEFSQMYHAPWIDRIRRTMLGAIVLGSSFSPMDLVCYVVGVMVGAFAERKMLWGKWG